MKNNKLENGAMDHFMVTMCKKTNKQTKKKKYVLLKRTMVNKGGFLTLQKNEVLVKIKL